MKLTAIEPGGAGQDLRFFTCPHCRRVQRHLIDSTVIEAWLKPTSFNLPSEGQSRSGVLRLLDRSGGRLASTCDPSGKAVTYDIRDGRLIPKPAK
jgi:hypothetical protein